MENRESKMELPLVSVVMPAYNAGQYIRQAVESVQAQTLKRWELLVIDDCSADQTRELVTRMAAADSRIRLIPNEENLGTAGSRNRGLDLARGEYVALLDSDDCWRPEKLEMQLSLAKKTDADLVCTSYALVDEQGEPCCRDYLVPGGPIDLDQLLVQNVIGCSTVLLSRRVVENYRFSTDYYHEDFALWLKLLEDGLCAVGMEAVLVDYRLHRNSRAANKISSARHRWTIYRSQMKLPLLKSCYCLIRYTIAGLTKYRKL